MNQKKWLRLVDIDPLSAVGRGSLLRFFDESWRREYVVLMICEAFGNSDFPNALVRLTGSKSGICPMQLLPNPSPGTTGVLNVKWLLDNWNEWVWPDSKVDDVWIRFEELTPDEFPVGLPM